MELTIAPSSKTRFQVDEPSRCVPLGRLADPVDNVRAFHLAGYSVLSTVRTSVTTAGSCVHYGQSPRPEDGSHLGSIVSSAPGRSDRRELMLPLTVIQPQRRRQSRAAYAGEHSERTLDGTPQRRLVASTQIRCARIRHHKCLHRKPQ